MAPFVLVTGNPHKAAEAERVLGRRLEVGPSTWRRSRGSTW